MYTGTELFSKKQLTVIQEMTIIIHIHLVLEASI